MTSPSDSSISAELSPCTAVGWGFSSAEILESDGEVTHDPCASAKVSFGKLKLSNSPAKTPRSRRDHRAHSRRSRSVTSSPVRSPGLKRTAPSPNLVKQILKQARQDVNQIESSKFKNGNTNVS